MGWTEYYKRDPYPIESLQPAYETVEKILQQQPFSKDSVNAVLGGFHPRSRLASWFPRFCSEIYPSKKVNIINLDMNSYPLLSLNQPNKIQAKIENPPFAPNSIDLFFLSSTFNFMSDEQIQKFAKQASTSLSSQGWVVASFALPWLPSKFESLLTSITLRTKFYLRKKQQITQLLSPWLHLYFLIETETPDHSPCEIFVLSKNPNSAAVLQYSVFSE